MYIKQVEQDVYGLGISTKELECIKQSLVVSSYNAKALHLSDDAVECIGKMLAEMGVNVKQNS